MSGPLLLARNRIGRKSYILSHNIISVNIEFWFLLYHTLNRNVGKKEGSSQALGLKY